MENNVYIEQQFREIVTDDSVAKLGVEERIARASINETLVVAVQDEFSARITLLGWGDDETSDIYEKCCTDANEKLMAVAASLQFEYGLNDEEILKAVERARLDIQKDKRYFD